MIAPQPNTHVRTTHVGSLIRPAELLQFIRPKQAGQPYDEQAYAKCLRTSVEAVVRRQVEAGIDVVSDGEFGKSISWSQYALERLSGFERRGARPAEHGFNRGADRARFAEFYRELDAAEGPPAAGGGGAGGGGGGAPPFFTRPAGGGGGHAKIKTPFCEGGGG